MLILSRDRDYPDLLAPLRGKRVAVWTCNTCARLCGDVGGEDSAERLAAGLRKDGIDVVRVRSVSASCLGSKVASAAKDLLSDDPDVILSLTCSIGAGCIGRCTGKDVINPVTTYGHGYLSEDGTPVLSREDGDIPVGELTSRCSPYL